MRTIVKTILTLFVLAGIIVSLGVTCFATGEPMTIANTQDGWYSNQDGETYYYVNGEPVTGWLNLGSDYYFFDKKTSKMVANNWVEDGPNNWYIIGASGKMLKGFQEVKLGRSDDGWYYFNPNHNGTFGKIITGWQNVPGHGLCFFETKHNGHWGTCTYSPVWGSYSYATKTWSKAAPGTSLTNKGSQNTEQTSPQKDNEHSYNSSTPTVGSVPDLVSTFPELKANAGKRVATLESIGEHGVLQGLCTDDEFVYAILERQKIPSGNTTKSECIIVKMKDWKVVSYSAPLPLDHGNDMTYNPKLGRLLVAHNTGNPKRVSFVDPATLTITGSVNLGMSINGIAYCSERNQYVVGVAGTYNFAILDENFHEVARYTGVNTDATRQGVDCDESGIYYPQSGPNLIVCYTWDGKHAGTITVAGDNREAENMFRLNGRYYLGFYTGSRKGGYIVALD